MWVRCIAACLTLIGSTHVVAQEVATFDDLPLGSDSYYNGADASGGFVSGGVFFSNDYDTVYGSWSGFCYSNVNDPTTPGFFNQYAVASGTDVSGFGNYAVVFDGTFGPEADVVELATPCQVRGCYVNNTTYTALSMLDGDLFSKQFGGPSGDDPDFFLLTVTGKDAGGTEVGSQDVYLADYRFTSNAQDYVLGDWTWVDLTSLGPDVATVHFSLSSSDMGAWGMNTPAYFAMDDLAFVPQAVWSQKSDLAISEFSVHISGPNRATAEASILNLGGQRSGGWLVVMVTHPALPRPIVRWQRVRPLEPGHELRVQLHGTYPHQHLSHRTYTVRAAIVPWYPRREITLENNQAMDTLTWE